MTRAPNDHYLFFALDRISEKPAPRRGYEVIPDESHVVADDLNRPIG